MLGVLPHKLEISSKVIGMSTEKMRLYNSLLIRMRNYLTIIYLLQYFIYLIRRIC